MTKAIAKPGYRSRPASHAAIAVGLITALSGVLSSAAIAAPPPSASFNALHLAAIIEASQTNEPRFTRDYKGKTFGAVLQFDSLQDGFFGQKLLNGRVGERTVTGIGRAELARAAIDW